MLQIPMESALNLLRILASTDLIGRLFLAPYSIGPDTLASDLTEISWPGYSGIGLGNPNFAIIDDVARVTWDDLSWTNPGSRVEIGGWNITTTDRLFLLCGESLPTSLSTGASYIFTPRFSLIPIFK